jgi:hypothetical protein
VFFFLFPIVTPRFHYPVPDDAVAPSDLTCHIVRNEVKTHFDYVFTAKKAFKQQVAVESVREDELKPDEE